MSDITFFSSESYKSFDDSGSPIYSYNLKIQDTVKDVNQFIASNVDSKSVASFSEFFCPYSTINTSGNLIPIARFFERPEIDEWDYVDDVPTGNMIEPDFGSGDCRVEVIAVDVARCLNYGIIPTFEADGQQIYDKEDMENINSVGARAPIMVTGFGYDTEGFPSPSIWDQKAHDSDDPDEFEEDEEDTINDIYRFPPEVKQRVDIWNSGPLDLRWDRYKRMFVASPEMFLGYALCDIPAASGRYAPVKGSGDPTAPGYLGYRSFNSGEIECAVGRYDSFHVPSGTQDGGQSSFSLHKLLIINRSVTMDIASGALVIATRLNNGEYFPIFADCAPDTL
jgi:hypothetical protein